jgi:RNA polymerase sigma-70 factor, ECF subfamily
MEHTEIAPKASARYTADLDARFERIFREYRTPIASYLLRLVDDPGLAEELAQEVFLRAYRALGSLPGDANERAWLYRIATNAAYDLLRRRRLLKWLPLLGHPRGPTPSVGGLEDRIAEEDAVRRALGKLSSLYRVPLILYTVEGFSTKEIAEMLGISANTAKVRLFRARQMFQEAYQEDRE